MFCNMLACPHSRVSGTGCWVHMIVACSQVSNKAMIGSVYTVYELLNSDEHSDACE